jgi:hypothetical protein
MDNLETYNRVKSLSPPLINTLLLSAQVLLIIITLIAIVSYWLVDIAPLYSLAATTSAAIFYFVLPRYARSYQHSCRFCGHPLHLVVRPFLLTQKYLAMQGQKQGDYFFTRCRWGYNLLQKRWVKISNQSLACHHCRLSENRQIEVYAPVSAGELKTLPSFD